MADAISELKTPFHSQVLSNSETATLWRNPVVGSTPCTRTSRIRRRGARFGPGCLSMSQPRSNVSFRQWSGPAPVGRARAGGALNQFGAKKMGSWRGQREVREQSAASSAFSSFHSFLTPFRGGCRTFEVLELLSPAQVTWRIQARTCSLAFWAASGSGSRNRSSSERARFDAKTAVGARGSLAMRHTNFRSVCSVKGHPPDSPRWAPKPNPVLCHKRDTKTQFSEQEIDFL